MSRNLRLLILLGASALCFDALIWSATKLSNAAPEQTSNTATSGVLTQQELRGKTIYHRGESPSGREMLALVGGLEVPGNTMTCANCHGTRGQGTTEGGITAGTLTWSHLTNPNGHIHPTGRKHGPFDEHSVARATVDCIDPNGNKLLAAMPCYRMSALDMADLVAYLKRIETHSDPGVTETSITVGSIIPTQGPLTEVGAAMRSLLVAYFEELNSRGGIHQRKVELRFAEMLTGGASTAGSAKALIESDQVFALVGGLSAGADKDLVALAQAQQIPFVGPSTLLPQTTANDYVFYLLPGMNEQARALVNYAASKPAFKKAKALLVLPENEIGRSAAVSVEDQAKAVGWGPVAKHTYELRGFNAALLIEKLKTGGSDVLFFLGAGAEAAALMKEAAAANWTPSVFLLGVLASDVTASTPLGFKDKVFMTFPTVPTDVTEAGRVEFRALQEKYKLPTRHIASQLAALAAAKVFVEGLKVAGKELSREKLIKALEGLSNFETGVTPRITFGPKQRIGARGAYIIAIDVDKKAFSPASAWIQEN